MKEESVNEEDMRGKRPSGDFYENLGEEHYCRRRTVFSVDIFWFGLESLGGLLQGCTRLLGVLGSGARNPHRILELGSRIGYS
jgi:hypothetical protein